MSWLPGLITDAPEEGFQLAIKLSRMAVKFTQPDDAVRSRLREDYANNADILTMASQVVAIDFQTVGAANQYCKAEASCTCRGKTAGQECQDQRR